MSEIPGLFQSLEEAAVYLRTPVSRYQPRASMPSHVVHMLRAHCYCVFFISLKFARVVLSISRQVQSASVVAAAQKTRLRGSGFVFTTLLVSLRYWLLGAHVVTPPPISRALLFTSSCRSECILRWRAVPTGPWPDLYKGWRHLIRKTYFVVESCYIWTLCQIVGEWTPTLLIKCFIQFQV